MGLLTTAAAAAILIAPQKLQAVPVDHEGGTAAPAVQTRALPPGFKQWYRPQLIYIEKPMCKGENSLECTDVLATNWPWIGEQKAQAFSMNTEDYRGMRAGQWGCGEQMMLDRSIPV